MLVIFDLELTAWPGSAARNWSAPGEYPEIIQIGAVRLDAGLRETAALDVAVKPRLNPVLSDFIVGLTGLTQERIDREGIGIEAALEELARFASGARFLLSNGDDMGWIRRNAALAGIANPLEALAVANLSGHFREAAGSRVHVVSSTLQEVFGFETPGRAHDGLADARGVAEALRRTLPAGGVPKLLAILDRRAAD